MSDERIPPFSTAAEQSVLGCILLQPNESVAFCLDRLPSKEVFYDVRHQNLYDLFVEMFNERKVIETMIVIQTLSDRGQLDAIGGAGYVAELMNMPPSAASIEHYVSILREKFVLRELIQVGTRMVLNAYDTVSAAETLEESERDVLRLGQSVQVGGEDPDIKVLVSDMLGDLDDAIANKGKPRGLTIGLPDLDSLTSGFRGGQMIVLAARPSCGKTSLAMNMAEEVAVTQKRPVGVFSLEMTAMELVFRMACSRARVNSKKARDGECEDREQFKLANVSGMIARSPIHICEIGGLTIGQLTGRARRMYQRHKIQFLVIDYIQLMQSHSKANRNEQLTIISNGLKALAKELNIPILVLSQLNREVTKENRPPRISDLRECGAIEQDADIIILLDPKIPPKEDGGEQSISDVQSVRALVPKNRNGPVNVVELTFMRAYTRFESASKIRDDEYSL